MAASEGWVAAGCALKGVQRGAHAETEEWLGGPYTVLRGVRQLVRSLKDLADRGAPQLPGVAKALPNGQVAAPVFPADPLDRILLRGITAEVWLDPEVTLDGVPESMAGGQRPASRRARVALVLGAGNVTSIGPMDVLHKLFSEGECVVLKLNPVNEAVGPALTEALRPLIDADVLRIMYGGAEVGDRLCQHDGIDSIHVTGSLSTHDRVVWGEGTEGRRPQARRDATEYTTRDERAWECQPGDRDSRALVQGGPAVSRGEPRQLVDHQRGLQLQRDTRDADPRGMVPAG